ncbi:hypothetical protein H106_05854 [Trichophyton rubrum CBS 735.88]|nr:hypothetical protein H106_05854 [Trichophyton rubrum CBS 735.88]
MVSLFCGCMKRCRLTNVGTASKHTSEDSVSTSVSRQYGRLSSSVYQTTSPLQQGLLPPSSLATLSSWSSLFQLHTSGRTTCGCSSTSPHLSLSFLNSSFSSGRWPPWALQGLAPQSQAEGQGSQSRMLAGLLCLVSSIQLAPYPPESLTKMTMLGLQGSPETLFSDRSSASQFSASFALSSACSSLPQRRRGLVKHTGTYRLSLERSSTTEDPDRELLHSSQVVLSSFLRSASTSLETLFREVMSTIPAAHQKS